MKNILLCIICVIISLSIYGRDIVAVANGDWTDPDTWGGFEPGPGDNIIIPAGITVQISSNESYEGDPMFITIQGTLEFVGGGSKLWLPCNSEVSISEEGHIVPSGAGGGSSKQLIICSEVVWEARDGELGGPIILRQSTLPVELVSFTGYVEDNVVKLEWSTASEINNDYFQLEKSRDGINYETLSIIKGKGTVNKMSYYSALDDVPEQGTTYYRLKQVDFDGKFAYSDMVSVNFHGSILDECKFKIFPNPCIGVCNVKLEDCNSADSDEITFYVYDAFGNTVLASSPKTISQGEAMFSFDSNNKLSPGMYIVRGNASEKKIEDRMIINK
ncbi:MAG: T9SS type A sorting domain-containing protein [Bacteroidota bacterium]